MFIDFFYLLREQKIPVSLNEWMVLMSALKTGLIDSDLGRFYFVARALLVKSEAHYDAFDQCFFHLFGDATKPLAIDDEIYDWLNRTPLTRYFSEEELAQLKKLSLEELNQLFEQRLKEQKEEHHGGNRWIGTGGTSPFGHGGAHPSGIRVGGAAGNRSAVKIAGERRYRNYRKDLTLDIRQIQIALKKLRLLKRSGSELELDLNESIGATCRNAGDIELVFHATKKNQTKVLLLMDAGGTMDPYADLVSRLFSAAHASSHFKDLKYYYFHNCVYSRVFKNIERSQTVPTEDLLRLYNEDYKLIFIGDAWMNPYELYYDNGMLDLTARERTPGLTWLKRLNSHFRKAIWLNPERSDYWEAETISAIRRIYKMFPLTLQGLEDGIQALL
jgi:uncharacterized protein with von Willebrand factor type A (vWA) domain